MSTQKDIVCLTQCILFLLILDLEGSIIKQSSTIKEEDETEEMSSSQSAEQIGITDSMWKLGRDNDGYVNKSIH